MKLYRCEFCNREKLGGICTASLTYPTQGSVSWRVCPSCNSKLRHIIESGVKSPLPRPCCANCTHFERKGSHCTEYRAPVDGWDSCDLWRADE